MTVDNFFLVWRPGYANPTKRHQDLQSAKTEAARLAEINPGSDFYVLQSVTVFSGQVTVSERPSPVVISDRKAKEFIPGVF